MNQKIGPREQALRDMRAKQLAPDKPAQIPRGFRASLDDRTTAEMMGDRDALAAKLPTTSGKKPVKRKAKKRVKR
jgi:hypothetical protein